MFVLVTLIVGAYARATCGDRPLCYCFPDLGTVKCKGQNVTFSPTFPEDVVSTTAFLNVIDTNITEMPPLKHWSKLEWITQGITTYPDCNLHENVPEEVHIL